jgi:hypothetical protein
LNGAFDISSLRTRVNKHQNTSHCTCFYTTYVQFRSAAAWLLKLVFALSVVVLYCCYAGFQSA